MHSSTGGVVVAAYAVTAHITHTAFEKISLEPDGSIVLLGDRPVWDGSLTARARLEERAMTFLAGTCASAILRGQNIRWVDAYDRCPETDNMDCAAGLLAFMIDPEAETDEELAADVELMWIRTKLLLQKTPRTGMLFSSLRIDWWRSRRFPLEGPGKSSARQ